MKKTDELEREQAYFDRAADARERSRQTLTAAPQSAAGSIAAASAVKRGAQNYLAKMGEPDEQVAFAMFEDDEGDCFYLGRHAISDAERNKLVINWKADGALAYFQASYDDPCGVTRRRKFVTDRNRVLEFDEVIFSELARSVGEITEADRNGIDDAVLRDLAQDRTGEMSDIVQTIHAAQYELVRSPLNQLLVIQGGPGTGKTAVALHRVSWLLFNHRDLAPDDVLVIGPNPTFSRYIRAVLPGLGDSEVVHRDLRSLGPISSTGRDEELAVRRLKGSDKMVAFLALALRQRVRFPAGAETVDVGPGARPTRLSAGDVEGPLRRYREGANTYNAGRSSFRNWLAGKVTDEATPQQIDAAVERMWPSLTPQLFLRDLLGSRERLVAAAGDDFTAGDVNRLLRPPASRLTEETWSDSDIALLDEAASLISGQIPTYRHVVIDEAQDLSPMQLRSARARSKNGSMTVVGDVAQSSGPWARDAWGEVVEALRQEWDPQIEELSLGYRVPEQIYALAARLLPQIAPSISPPRIVRRGPEDPQLVQCDEDERIKKAVTAARDYAGRGLFVGLIVPDSMREDLVDTLRRADVAWSDAGKGDLSKSINVMSAEQAKGLEFDAVVLIEPEAIAEESETGLRLLYVALTRSTRYLTVTYSGVLIPTKKPVDLGGNGKAPEEAVSPAETNGSQEVTVEAPPAKLQPAISRPRPLSAAETLFDVAVVPSAQARPSAPRPAPPAPLGGSSPDLGRVIAVAVASTLAQDIRGNVPSTQWAYLIDRIRRDLQVSGEEILDLIDD